MNREIYSVLAKYQIQQFEFNVDDMFTYRLGLGKDAPPEMIEEIKSFLPGGVKLIVEQNKGSLLAHTSMHESTQLIDNVNHPHHYNRGKIEVIEALEDWKLDFHCANAVKYIARAGVKDPTKEIEDLEKARWYLQRKIELLKARNENRKPIKPNDMTRDKKSLPCAECGHIFEAHLGGFGCKGYFTPTEAPCGCAGAF